VLERRGNHKPCAGKEYELTVPTWATLDVEEKQ
jgi:hypothetical protein